MKVYDCFTFFNELDVLLIRLEYLYEYVDYFVVVESSHTHSGKEKPWNFQNNMKLFEKYLKKIIYIKDLNQLEQESSFKPANQFDPKDEFWKLENKQRNAILQGLDKAKSNDIIIVSDVDEIPSVNSMKKLKSKLFFNKRITFIQDLRLYFINCKATGKEEYWYGSIALKKKNIQNSIQSERDRRFKNKTLSDGGYHFSYLGGLDAIITKIESFAHSEFNKTELKNRDEIMARIKNGQDIYNRKNYGTSLIDKNLTRFDPTLDSILTKYPHLFSE
ncbi:MAG: hypothetical protein ACPGU5_00915 [Lishizhenia sp.]